jgi:AcrR family transcriptional regulator
MPEPMEKWVEQLLKLNDEEKMTDKQIKIIQAAIELFSEKGYAGSSTSEIAQKAGVAEGTIFRHYKTKKDLLISIVAPIMINIMGPLLMKEFAKVLNAPYESFEDFLRAVIRNRLEFVRNNLPMVKILIQEIPFHDDLRQSFKEVAGKHVLEHFVRVVEHYQKEGAILAAPDKSVIRFVISNGIGLIMALVFIVPELDWDEEEEIERTVHMIMHGLKP